VGHNSWWIHSRLGAWITPYGHEAVPRRAHRLASRFRLSDLLEPQLGWWAPRGPSAEARGHFPDEMEYFAAKTWPSTGLCRSRRPRRRPTLECPNGGAVHLLGWYERLRLARYFDAPTLQQVGEPGREFRLRQDPAGQWQFTPVHLAKHRISAVGNAPSNG